MTRMLLILLFAAMAAGGTEWIEIPGQEPVRADGAVPGGMLDEVQTMGCGSAFVVMTAYGSIEHAVEAVRRALPGREVVPISAVIPAPTRPPTMSAVSTGPSIQMGSVPK